MKAVILLRRRMAPDLILDKIFSGDLLRYDVYGSVAHPWGNLYIK